MIFISVMFGFEVFNFNIYRLIIKLLILVIVSLIGINILSKDKNNEDIFNEYFTIFNDKKFIINDKNIKVIKLTSLFGNINIDLRNIKLSDDIIIDNYVIFGKVNLYVSDNVKVINDLYCLFGKSSIRNKINNDKINNIKLKGIVMFGGVSIK